MIKKILERVTAKFSGRSRSIGLFAISSLLSRGVGIACQLLQVPIALHALGQEGFGLWMTLQSMLYLIAFADCGVGIGVQNRIAEAFGMKDYRGAHRLFNTAFVFLFAVASLLACLFVPAAWLLNVESIFGLKDAEVIAGASPAMAVVLGLFCLGFPFGLAQRLAYGMQRGWAHNISQALGNIAGLGLLILAAHYKLGLAMIILAAQLPTLLQNIVLIIYLARPLGWLKVGDFQFDFPQLKGLLGLGAMFGIQQILGSLVVALPAVVISSTLGAAAVTPYNLAQRLFNLFAVVQNAFMLPLWPAYSEANAKGEYGWMRRTLSRSVIATLLISISPMLVGGIFFEPIINLWIGNQPDHPVMPTPGLIMLLFLWNAVVFIQQPFGYLLAGVSHVKRLTFFSVASALLSVPLMFLLVKWHGAEGVVLALLVGYVPFNLLGSILETARFLKMHPLTDKKPG